MTNLRTTIDRLLDGNTFAVSLKEGDALRLDVEKTGVVTPSNLHFVIKDADDNPMANVRYRIEFEDGTPTVSGETDAKGEIHHYVPTESLYHLFIEEIPGRQPG